MENKLTDAGFRALFAGAGDFVRRELSCGGLTLYAYFIDGITAGADLGELVFRPLYRNAEADMTAFYRKALTGSVYCATLPEVTEQLRRIARPGDVVMTVGAGDIFRAGEALLK